MRQGHDHGPIRSDQSPPSASSPPPPFQQVGHHPHGLENFFFPGGGGAPPRREARLAPSSSAPMPLLRRMNSSLKCRFGQPAQNRFLLAKPSWPITICPLTSRAAITAQGRPFGGGGLRVNPTGDLKARQPLSQSDRAQDPAREPQVGAPSLSMPSPPVWREIRCLIR